MTTVEPCPGVMALLLADAMEHGYPGSPRGSSIARILDMVFYPQPRAIARSHAPRRPRLRAVL